MLGVIALALVLLLDAAPPAGTPAGAAVAAAPVEDRIAGRLARVNPELTAGEVERISAAVVRYSGKYGLDPALVAGVIEVESTARPWVQSPKGALGLMQVMPHMIRPLGLAGNPNTIETNIEAGCMILADNIRRLGEDDGISAYFWGSQIRGVSYLNRVQAARERVNREIRS